MIKSHYIVLDNETGGLDKDKNPITQFAAVILDAFTLKELDRFETFVKPYDDLIIEPEALKKTMVSMSDINNGMDKKTFCKTLWNFLTQWQVKSRYKDQGRLVPVGHNWPFDEGFLEYILGSVGKDLYEVIHEQPLDTWPIAKLAFGLNGDTKLNLTAATGYAKIKLTDAHGAMNDVEATAKLLRWFMKKLRSDGGDVISQEGNERKRGVEFFEFKCGAK